MAIEWEFGDGDTATGAVVQHTYMTPGEYYPIVRVPDPRRPWFINSYRRPTPIIVTLVAPIAEFSSDIQTIIEGQQVQFANESTGGFVQSYEWRANGLLFSTQENPLYQFLVEGIYTISLRVSNSGGFDVEEKIGYITVEPESGIWAPTGLIATGTEAGVQLDWTDNSDNETAFEIYHSILGGDPEINPENWSLIDTVGAGVITYFHSGALEGFTNFYTIRAITSGSQSNWSNVDSAVVLGTGSGSGTGTGTSETTYRTTPMGHFRITPTGHQRITP